MNWDEPNKITTREEKQQLAVKVTLIGSFVDTLLGITKIMVGLIFNSHALVIDGIHSFSDLATDGLVLFLGKISHEAPDKNHPYGHEKFETLGATALGSVLIATGGALIYDTIKNLINGEHEIQEMGWPTGAVALLSIVSKEIIFQYSFRIGEKLKSKLLMANAWHSRTDAISSIVVLIGLIFGFLGYSFFDEVAALIVSAMIAKVGWDFVKESLIELSDTGVNREMAEQIKTKILETDGVQSCHALRSRRMGPKILVDVNIEVDAKLTASEGHEICSWVARNLKDQFDGIEDVTVHLDVEDDRSYQSKQGLNPFQHEYKGLLPLRSVVLKELQAQWKGIFDLNKADEIRLYYINRQINLEIVMLNNPWPATEFPQKIEELNRTNEIISWLGTVHFLFKER
jgi:cation diffusion facilitator family transporter